MTGLYVRDPIGRFYYNKDPNGSDAKAYRENIGISAFLYAEKVKPFFIEAANKLDTPGYGVGWLMLDSTFDREEGEIAEKSDRQFRGKDVSVKNHNFIKQ